MIDCCDRHGLPMRRRISVGIYATSAWEQVAYVVGHADVRFLFVENEEQLDKWILFRD